MRIVIFNHSFFFLSETFIYKQITGLPVNIEATLLSFQFANENLFPTSNPKIGVTRSANLIDRAMTGVLPPRIKKKLGFSLFNYFKVRKILRKGNVDAIHVHFGFNAVIIAPLAKLLNIPLIVTFHGVDASPQKLNNEKYKNAVRELIRYARAVIIVSPHMIDTLDLSQWQHKTHLIPCGVDPAEFTNHSTPSKEEHIITILHSGRLVAKKGVPDLIRVFIDLDRKGFNIRMNIIGDGPELAMCQELVKEAGCRNIEFLGGQSQDVVRQYMSRADIFVLNSRTSENGDMEGLPVSLLEAMSMKLPVVSTYHAGIPYTITDGVNGLLVKERDNAGLEKALEKLITSDVLRADLGKAARQTVENVCTIDQMNRKILAVYNSL